MIKSCVYNYQYYNHFKNIDISQVSKKQILNETYFIITVETRKN